MPNETRVLKPDLMRSNGGVVEVTDEYWNSTCGVILEQFEAWARNGKVRDAFARVVSGAFGPSVTADLMLYAGIDHDIIEATIAHLRETGHSNPAEEEGLDTEGEQPVSLSSEVIE